MNERTGQNPSRIIFNSIGQLSLEKIREMLPYTQHNMRLWGSEIDRLGLEIGKARHELHQVTYALQQAQASVASTNIVASMVQSNIYMLYNQPIAVHAAQVAARTAFDLHTNTISLTNHIAGLEQQLRYAKTQHESYRQNIKYLYQKEADIKREVITKQLEDARARTKATREQDEATAAAEAEAEARKATTEAKATEEARVAEAEAQKVDTEARKAAKKTREAEAKKAAADAKATEEAEAKKATSEVKASSDTVAKAEAEVRNTKPATKKPNKKMTKKEQDAENTKFLDEAFKQAQQERADKAIADARAQAAKEVAAAQAKASADIAVAQDHAAKRIEEAQKGVQSVQKTQIHALINMQVGFYLDQCSVIGAIYELRPSMVLKKDPNINNPLDIDRNTYLHHAAVRGDETIVRILITMGANAHQKNEKGECPSDLTHNENIIKILKEDINPQLPETNSESDTELFTKLFLLHYAVEPEPSTIKIHGLPELISSFRAHSMFEWSYNVHLLNFAILLNDVTTVEMLLSSGINPRHKENGLTPFDILTKITDKRILKLLSEQLKLSDEQKQLFEEFLTTGKSPFDQPGDLFTTIPEAAAAASKRALPESTEDVLENPLFTLTDPHGTMSVLGEVG